MSDPGAEPARYRTLVESVADPMYWLAPDGTVELVNGAMADLVGVPRERLIGADAAAFLDDDDAAVVEEILAEQLSATAEEPARYEFELSAPGGGTRWVEANFAPVVEDGAFRGSVGVVRDVTDRRRREMRLAEFETIVETAPIGLFTLDEDAVVTWANEVYVETLSIPRERLVGEPFTDLVEAGYYEEALVERYLEAVRTLLSEENDRDQDSYRVETRLPDGETLVHEVYVALLPLDDGEFQGTIIAFRDVTAQKRYERELRRQNERLDEFASVVSHDLRNPLNLAVGYLERAMRTGNRDHLETVREAHERMQALIEDLLSLAREGDAVGERAPVDVAEVARGAWRASDTGAATLELLDPGTVLADDGRLVALFENLFRNSVEHGSPGGAGGGLTVTVGRLPDGFYVADDGVGIPAAERDRVFEYGHSGAGGTGLGLAIVETVAEAHGWTVAVTESETGGARFEFRGVDRPAEH